MSKPKDVGKLNNREQFKRIVGLCVLFTNRKYVFQMNSGHIKRAKRLILAVKSFCIRLFPVPSEGRSAPIWQYDRQLDGKSHQ